MAWHTPRLQKQPYIAAGAPRHLTERYLSPASFPGRKLLGQLLAAETLKSTWRYLARWERTDFDWDRLFGDIAAARLKSREMASRQSQKAERDANRNVASMARSLSQQIRQSLPSLDVLAYRLFPDDVLAALHLPDLNDRPPLDRDDAAHRLLPCWPSAPELLEGLALLADQEAAAAMVRPRPDVQANRGDAAVRVFVWELAQNFQRRHGRPMYGSVAAIAQVVFADNRLITKEYVRDVWRRAQRGVSVKRRKTL